jgi:hypothetical protein
MVSVNLPVDAVLEVETLNVDEPEPLVMEVGLNVPVTPLGNPPTVKLTVPVKPFSGLTLAV